MGPPCKIRNPSRRDCWSFFSERLLLSAWARCGFSETKRGRKPKTATRARSLCKKSFRPSPLVCRSSRKTVRAKIRSMVGLGVGFSGGETVAKASLGGGRFGCNWFNINGLGHKRPCKRRGEAVYGAFGAKKAWRRNQFTLLARQANRCCPST